VTDRCITSGASRISWATRASLAIRLARAARIAARTGPSCVPSASGAGSGVAVVVTKSTLDHGHEFQVAANSRPDEGSGNRGTWFRQFTDG
jgi:hypothetical protein